MDRKSKSIWGFSGEDQGGAGPHNGGARAGQERPGAGGDAAVAGRSQERRLRVGACERERGKDEGVGSGRFGRVRTGQPVGPDRLGRLDQI